MQNNEKADTRLGRQPLTAHGDLPRQATGQSATTAPEKACSSENHFWDETADAEGDTCNCGDWYRFRDRIERTPASEMAEIRKGDARINVCGCSGRSGRPRVQS